MPTLMSLDVLRFAKMDRHFLQSLVTKCCEYFDKQPVLRQFIGRLHSMQLVGIYLPKDFADTCYYDPNLENQLLGLVTNKKWALIADMFLKIPLKKYHEMNTFALKLFEIVTEESAEDIDTVFHQFVSQCFVKQRNRNLPIHMATFSQLAASIIVHLREEPVRALPTILDCFKFNLSSSPFLFSFPLFTTDYR